MKRSKAIQLAVLLLVAARALAASPYPGEQGATSRRSRRRKVDAYLAGQSVGFAKAAKLNGYA
jgi:hypothetical protein